MTVEVRRVRKREAGWGLAGVILWTGLLVFLLLVLHLEVANLASLGGGLESQLYSFVLAENGLEFARSVMQVVNANQLLAGRDGIFDASRRNGWRNPLSLSQARAFDVSREWAPESDDGLPWDPITGQRRAQFDLESGRVFVRFSNNPEEGPDEDLDGVLIARSMGVAKSLDPAPAGLGTALRNHATLLEARLRHSRYFHSPAPIILWESGFRNRGGAVHSDAGPLVGWVGPEASAQAALTQLANELNIGPENSDSLVQNLTPFYRDNRHRSALFESGFWDGFLSRLDDFIDSRSDEHLLYLSEGGVLSGHRDGLVLSRGELLLDSGAQIQGLVLHIGEQDMTMQAGSAVTGAVWKVSIGSARPGSLQLESGSRVEFNLQAIDRALEALPSDLLEFRIIFPEMKQ